TRVGGDWRDAHGRPWPNQAVDDLLATLAALHPLRSIEAEPAEIERYGIGERRLRIVRDDGSPALDLEIGRANPADTALYIRRTGEPTILLVGSVLRWELDKLTRAPLRDDTDH